LFRSDECRREVPIVQPSLGIGRRFNHRIRRCNRLLDVVVHTGHFRVLEDVTVPFVREADGPSLVVAKDAHVSSTILGARERMRLTLWQPYSFAGPNANLDDRRSCYDPEIQRGSMWRKNSSKVSPASR